MYVYSIVLMCKIVLLDIAKARCLIIACTKVEHATGKSNYDVVSELVA
jgi:hypothetical protein